MKTIVPNGAFVLAKPDEVQTASRTGLMLGEQSREVPKTAVVEAVGDSVVGFKQGDRIIYKDYTTTDIKLDSVDYIVLEHIDIIGVIVETGK
jgi:chaperonin GroES